MIRYHDCLFSILYIQILFLGHSPATESWAVGCVLYALIFGRPPFETDNLEKTYKRIERGDFSYPSHIPISRDAHSLIES